MQTCEIVDDFRLRPTKFPDGSLYLSRLTMALDKEQIVESLEVSPLFAGCSKEILLQVAKRVKYRQYFSQDVIVWQGQPSTSLFLIVNGIVAVKQRTRDTEQVLAYLMSGNSFGEVGILENQPRSATVQALSEVDALVIQREDFIDILESHAKVAIGLAKVLGNYLLKTNKRKSGQQAQSRVMLLIPTEKSMGAGTIASLMAAEIINLRQMTTAILDYPNAHRILGGFQVDRGKLSFRHQEGFDLLLPQLDKHLPSSTRTTILMEQLMESYDNLVVIVRGELDEGATTMLEHADQILIIAPPTDKGKEEVARIRRKLKGKIRPEETNVMVMVNQTTPAHIGLPEDPEADFNLAYLSEFPAFQIPPPELVEVPEPLSEIVRTCVQRLERNQSIGIFIPTTTDVNTTADTSGHMDAAMAFMAERFGGATCKIVNGVWLSDRLGLVGEVVYVVYSYLTQADMTKYLDEVVDYLKTLKRELNQEAMALEINRKLTLI